MAEPTHAGTAADPHAAPKESWLLLDATGWVALAMLALLGIMFWQGAFGAIGGALDRKIARIKAELADAERLRAEADQLRAEMQASRDAALADAERIRAAAEREAETILAAAHNDAERRVALRAKAAEERIAAAEREAEADLRGRAARLATEAARRLLADGAARDAAAAETDRAIAVVGARL